MIDQILKFYSDGNLSDGATLAGIILSRFGSMSDKELAEKMHKSIRTIQSYRAQLKKIAPVSKLGSFNNSKSLTNQPEQDHIYEVLSKYNKTPLVQAVRAIFIKHEIEPNAEALEYIVKDTLRGVKCGRIKNFTKYLLYMIPIQWGEALVESTPKEEKKTEPIVLSKKPQNTPNPLDQPKPDQDAEQVWNQVVDNLAIPETTKLLLRSAVPTALVDDILTVCVNDFTKNYIENRYKQIIDNSFEKAGYRCILSA